MLQLVALNLAFIQGNWRIFLGNAWPLELTTIRRQAKKPKAIERIKLNRYSHYSLAYATVEQYRDEKRN